MAFQAPEPQRIFAACAPGLEPILAAELARLGLAAKATPGGVDAAGVDAVALACIGSRVADAVALRLPLERGRSPDAALRKARERLGPATSVVRRPGAEPVLSADAVGSPLFKRGWRARVGAAPLRESLAAAMLLAAGFDGERPFLDPMCGSGTLAIEAAELAARRAPGRSRRFAFESWPGHDAERTAAVRRGFAGQERRPPCSIHASDRNGGALRLAEKNAVAAGAAELIAFARADVARLSPPPGPGLLAVNPPYGLRLDDGVEGAWRALGELLQRIPGWRAVVISPGDEPERWLGRAPAQELRVRNGGLPCRILVL